MGYFLILLITLTFTLVSFAIALHLVLVYRKSQGSNPAGPPRSTRPGLKSYITCSAAAAEATGELPCKHNVGVLLAEESGFKSYTTSTTTAALAAAGAPPYEHSVGVHTEEMRAAVVVVADPSYEDECDSLDLQLALGLAQPPRLLFTIREESGEDADSEEDVSMLKSKSEGEKSTVNCSTPTLPSPCSSSSSLTFLEEDSDSNPSLNRNTNQRSNSRRLLNHHANHRIHPVPQTALDLP